MHLDVLYNILHPPLVAPQNANAGRLRNHQVFQKRCSGLSKTEELYNLPALCTSSSPRNSIEIQFRNLWIRGPWSDSNGFVLGMLVSSGALVAGCAGRTF